MELMEHIDILFWLHIAKESEGFPELLDLILVHLWNHCLENSFVCI